MKTQNLDVSLEVFGGQRDLDLLSDELSFIQSLPICEGMIQLDSIPDSLAEHEKPLTSSETMAFNALTAEMEGRQADRVTTGERITQDDYAYVIKYLRANPEASNAQLQDVFMHLYSQKAEDAVTSLAPIVKMKWDGDDWFAIGNTMTNHSENGRSRFEHTDAVMRNEWLRNSVEVAEAKRLKREPLREYMSATGAIKEFASPKPTRAEMPDEVVDKLFYDRFAYRINWMSPDAQELFTRTYSIFDLPAEAVAKARGLEDTRALAVMRDSNMRKPVEGMTHFEMVEDLITSALPFVTSQQEESLLVQLEEFREENQQNLQAIAERYTEEDMHFYRHLADSENLTNPWMTQFIASRYKSLHPKHRSVVDRAQVGEQYEMNETLQEIVWALHTVSNQNRAGVMAGDRVVMERFIEGCAQSIGEADAEYVAQYYLDAIYQNELQLAQLDIASPEYDALRGDSDDGVSAADVGCGGSCGPSIQDIFENMFDVGSEVADRDSKNNKLLSDENGEAIAACPSCKDKNNAGQKTNSLVKSRIKIDDKGMAVCQRCDAVGKNGKVLIKGRFEKKDKDKVVEAAASAIDDQLTQEAISDMEQQFVGNETIDNLEAQLAQNDRPMPTSEERNT